ncbi:methionine sulfoxide reductase B [Candidatus Falkowbacteria bacterium RIFOXYA2_FULL_35_8]|uniref:peptide-methionine (R)-S-oxide reductase n=1 Tax=Candidatus Falkowbacteria bacterium RIFOXYC2_FULL_36_12 TaxID=1798002 RepID=A0A1F5SYS4_9BACT|nr:MAG: methionine sulfoxide reductase B [Candidatus Falkowbacteria bacterium RIFOXYB2_FULL_35_7]OGF31850.1 MAG: methionine sulfoxide reductase B [Candidatus Falkowbacteria bacterium RIFOXYC2_FULL_36_12]OGF34628.1 MAG: methionine sulfoxide reductase B [Candidatus Falkowbacteria bacterium RIFOXYA2_FULL_35_8]
MKYNPLTPEEANIIENKATEPAFSGEYYQHFQTGKYICRRCNAELYKSEHKFQTNCGWPSFDAEILGAVKHLPDPDGQRTEIQCANCGAHLGHVFTNEHYTEKNTRHCVNSLSIKFVPYEK